MLNEATKLFTENYGIWGEHSQNLGEFPVSFSLLSLLKLFTGKHVKLSTRRLRDQIPPDPRKPTMPK